MLRQGRSFATGTSIDVPLRSALNDVENGGHGLPGHGSGLRIGDSRNTVVCPSPTATDRRAYDVATLVGSHLWRSTPPHDTGCPSRHVCRLHSRLACCLSAARMLVWLRSKISPSRLSDGTTS